MIQKFGAVLHDLNRGGLVLQSGISKPGALGDAHRQSGNVRLRDITDVDTAAHEFGHRLQDALGIRAGHGAVYRRTRRPRASQRRAK